MIPMKLYSQPAISMFTPRLTSRPIRRPRPKGSSYTPLKTNGADGRLLSQFS